jgi:FkbM family methyltransferase
MINLWQRVLLWLCQYNRLHQNFPGRWRLCEFLGSQSRHLTALAPMEVKVGIGTYLHLDPREKFDGLKTLIHGLNPREPITNLTLQILRPGDNALDIGANVGYFAALASLTVGAHGHVYAVEAAPATYARLQTLVRRNRWKNIQTFPFAASDRAGEVELYCGPLDHTGTTSMRDLGGRTSSTTRVAAVAVDDLLDQLPPIRLVKIDVEGAEALATLGMTKLLARDRPYVLMEVSDSFLRSLGSSKGELLRLYESRGYRTYRVDRQVTPYEEREEYQCDVLLVPEGYPPVPFRELAEAVSW